MHRSRLAGFIVDCRDTDPAVAATFWSAALGMPPTGVDAGPGYVELNAGRRDLHVEVQRVDHDSRVHLDIETDDKEAEVRRLEQLGAKRVKTMPRWVVLEAPTGQRFCVVNAHASLVDAPGVTVWP
jgi:Glyoxalase-like domain